MSFPGSVELITAMAGIGGPGRLRFHGVTEGPWVDRRRKVSQWI